jgi:excisionase family DNA binding protein
MTDGPHTQPHMSPTEAAQRIGVSRWSIMRAIKTHKLGAKRDNRNHWLITPDDLSTWSAQSAHNVRQQTAAPPHEVIELREKLASETARANAAERARDQAEADRDAWKQQATALLSRPTRTRRWWPW